MSGRTPLASVLLFMMTLLPIMSASRITRAACTTEPSEGVRMPSIITHDLFAKDIYGERFESIGGSRDEAEAFLLGNQGPDPLFYVAGNPLYWNYRKLASTLHRMRPTEFLLALKRAVPQLSARERSVGRAYVLGFACHYELDRAMHPFIESQVRALCEAGVEGLDEQAKSEVHATIETELDELALTVKRGETVAAFNPATATLQGRTSMLDTVSRLYGLAVHDAFHYDIPAGLFKSGVILYRTGLAALYSPNGWKSAGLAAVERLVRPHSMASALSHRAIERTDSVFANSDHASWRHPYVEAVSTASFWDLYDQALAAARDALDAMDEDDFNEEAARSLTADMNFYGAPVVALVVAVEDGENAQKPTAAPDSAAADDNPELVTPESDEEA